MIRLVKGNPGSGKSYYAANYLDKFCTYDGLYKDHKLNDGVLIISNLEGLKLRHLDFEQLVQRFTIEKFLTIENFEKLIDKYKARHVILIIDEAQKFLDSKFYDKDVFYFFQYHRHLGIDIFLLTQCVSTVCRQLPPLCEFIIEAAPRSKGIVGTFRYKFIDTKGTFMYSQVVRKKQEVFAMYKSFSSDEAEKPKNVLSHWIITAAVVICFVIFGFKGFFYAYAHRSEKSRIVSAPGPARPILPERSSSTSYAPLGPTAVAVVPSGSAVPVQPLVPAIPLQSSVPSQATGTIFSAPAQDLPRVSGYVSDLAGGKHRYLLTSGQIVVCSRSLSVGDIYIK